MHTIEIPEKKILRYIPADLSECTPQQYMDMCELILRFQNTEISFEDFKTHAVYKLLDMKPEKSPFGIDDEIKYSNVYFISELIETFFDDSQENQKTIKQSYIHNPVPKIKILLTNYYGPQDSFMDVTFGEYRDALRLFHDFHATGDVSILYLIAAIFYRPKKWFKRLPYNSSEIDKRASNFKYAPKGFIYGVYLYFASFQKYLCEAKILWGGKELDFSILFDTNQENNSELPGIGMDSIAFTMSESGIFGNIEGVDKTNLWQILVQMYEAKRTDIERKNKESNVTTN